jgi:1-acyl-sn-glycerol-3-phosphate acyltransferase
MITNQADQHIRYPAIEPVALRAIAGSMLVYHRSLHSDALRMTAKLRPSLRVNGREHIPAAGPCLITANHYSRPGFPTAWIGLSISSVVPHEVTWITVTEWVYPGQWREHILRPVMRFALGGIRRGYDFLAMPTMVPGYASSLQRADGVRKVMHAVRQNPNIVLGLTPEGMDFPGGNLGTPPPGAGKFILALNQLGLRLLPVAVFEDHGALTLHFGESYNLSLPPDLPSEEVDAFVSTLVMGRIARLME